MIWNRYIIREFLKTFFFVFLALFFLGSLIDFSAHMKSFFQDGISLSAILLYYLAQLSRQGEIFLCVALLLATIKTLSQSSVRGEIWALCTAGIPLRKLTYPLLGLSLLAVALLFANSEYVQPKAARHLALFEDSFFKKSGRQQEVLALPLEDQSRLIYSYYDKENGLFHNLFWVHDLDHIVHMEKLSFIEHVGSSVSTLKRVDGELVRTSFEESVHFPNMSFESRALSQVTLPIEWQPISQLSAQFGSEVMRDFEAKALVLFLQKLTAPLMALLVFLAPLPFALRFGRQRRLFLLYALSIAAFLGYIAATSALAILAKSLILSPFVATLALPLVLLLYFGMRYAKL
ncbi:MAG: hypothetical protein S4CHLAM81_01250 [Chlamydiales bacterium]|nr:hypothetical protein [Chlamydiales bacterium]MCH9634921.1 hypothetical protein [Chlamydiales bacterium]MCH9703391.1 LptF/LptG family permease [Chlamydiota bacterium]